MGVLNYEKETANWKWDIPEYFNLGYDCVDKHAEGKNKNKIALLWENEKGDTKTYTFFEIKKLSNKFGNVLRDLGFKKGDRFLIRLPNIPAFQISFIGGVKIGAVPIPSSVMFRDHEIEYRINDSGSKAVITTSKYADEVRKIRDKCPSLKHVILIDGHQENELSYQDLMNVASDELVIEKTKNDDMAFFCYTSGTTGNPKGAVHMHRWAIGNDPSALYWQNVKPDDIVGHTGDLSWIFPLGNGFLFVWRHGITTFMYDGRFDPYKWLSFIEKYNITNFASVPTCYRIIISRKDVEKSYDLSSLRHCISAGEPLNPGVINEWKKRFKLDIYDGIGMTEVMVYLSNLCGMDIKVGSCGRPQPGKISDVVDRNGVSLPSGEHGVLAVHKNDPGLFKEYWRKPDKTKSSFKGDWFLTGDVLYKDDDGYFWFSGRDDDLIMAAGYRISPFEVESALVSHPDVLEAAVVASPDDIRGVIVKAFVILHDQNKASDDFVKILQEHTRKVSAPYKYPREIEFVRELPKTQSGKIKRKVLREFEKRKKLGDKNYEHNCMC